MRDAVNVELENARQTKTISANLSACVELEAEADGEGLLTHYADFLPTLFGVSEVRLAPARSGAGRARVRKAEGVKCERCWRIVPRVTADGICDRCVEALAEPVNR